MKTCSMLLHAAVLSVVLSACGGGGGDGATTTSPPISGPTPPASSPGTGASGVQLSFNPYRLTANQQAGTSSSLTLWVTVSNASLLDGDVHVVVTDSQGVLNGSPTVLRVDAQTFSVTANTKGTLAVGPHEGTFEIRLCRDAVCASPYPGAPTSLGYEVTVAAQPLTAATLSVTSATVQWNGVAPAPVTVAIGGSPSNWTASANTSWLVLTGASGSGNGNFSVGIVPSGVAVGDHVGRVTVSSSDGQSAELQFNLSVLPTQFVLTSGVPTFSAINGTPIGAQPVSFELGNQVGSPWSATSSAGWLGFTPSTGTTPATVTLQPDPTVGALASGTHAANLVLSSPGIADRIVPTQLILTKPTLSANSASVTLGGTKGRDLTPVTLPISLNTGSTPWPYALSALPAWLSSTTTVGSVQQNGSTLSFVPTQGAPAGSVSAAVTATATVNGDTVQLPLTVNLNADQRRLLAEDWGVGFSSTPFGSVLNRDITIRDNFGGGLNWTATSDRAWLTVASSSGTTGGASSLLTLNANPDSLPDGVVSNATVTVSTSTPGVSPAVIRVALWKSASALAAAVEVVQDYTQLVADPIRPLVYAHDEATSIDVFNVHTAQRVGTIPAAGTRLGAMGVSSDGATLYALDKATNSLSVIDLATLTRTATWPLSLPFEAESPTVTVSRTNGVDIVFLGYRTAYKDGRSFGTVLDPNPGGPMVASRDGKRLYVLSTFGASAYDIDYSEMSGGVLMVARVGPIVGDASFSNSQDIALSPDGSTLYMAFGAPYQCATGSTAGFLSTAVPFYPAGSFLAGGGAYPNNVTVTRDGRAICGISESFSGAGDFWVHPTSGAAPQQYMMTGELLARQLVVSPDGYLVVGVFHRPGKRITFIPIGP